MTESFPDEAAGRVLSAARAADHETALDILGIAIVCYAVLIEQEEGRPAPDAGLLAQWEGRIAAISGLRHTLDPHDADQVRRVADEYADLVRKLDKMIEDS